jgi:hypothetical protein
MIYCEDNFLFIHIPRTAGWSITKTLAPILCTPKLFNGSFISTASFSSFPMFHIHSTANDIRKYIPDWNSIYKFAVFRPDDEIIESDYRLHKSEHCRIGTGQLKKEWEKSVILSQNETLEEFKKRRWDIWLKGQTTWEYWIGNNDFHKLDFHNINEEFKSLLKRFNIPETELLKINGA